ncbi:hypothetical protein NY486_17875, partial [Enterobacter hormaechei]|nr:hypothetical protein [Enterobacter hormaechei]
SIYDVDFVNLILGEDYVNMTTENIKNGNAVGVYQDGANWATSFLIMKNNLQVGAQMFMYGIFGGIGTLIYLMQN